MGIRARSIYRQRGSRFNAGLSIGCLLLSGSLFLTGCVLIEDFGQFSGAGGDGGTDVGLGMDGGMATDAGSGDAGPDICSPGESLCAGECVDLSSALSHCGDCGFECQSPVGSVVSCDDGICVERCEMGFQECDSSVAGCETESLDTQHCGTCGNACPSGTFCSNEGGITGCVDSCSAVYTACGGSCVDTSINFTHCGACDNPCPTLDHAERNCSSGICTHTCSGWYTDCNGDLSDPSTSDGCEIIPPLYYQDGDRDGVGAGTGVRYCTGTEPTDWVTTPGDCADSNLARTPGKTELCNGFDDNCVGGVDEGFTAADGTALGDVCRCESGAVGAIVACDGLNSAACQYPMESCNGLDDDCDGTADNGFACRRGQTETCSFEGPTCMIEGIRTCSTTCAWECQPPAEICGGGDDNCNGFADEGLLAPQGTRVLIASPTANVNSLAVGWSAWNFEYGIFWTQETSPGAWDWFFVSLNRNGVPLMAPISVRQINRSPNDWAIGWDGTGWSLLAVESRTIQRVQVDRNGNVMRTGALMVPEAQGSADQISVAQDDNEMLLIWSRFISSTTKEAWAARIVAGVTNTAAQISPTVSLNHARPVGAALGMGDYYVFVPTYELATELGTIAHRRLHSDGTQGPLATLDLAADAEVGLHAGYDRTAGQIMLSYQSLHGIPAGGGLIDPVSRSFTGAPGIDANGWIAPDGQGNFAISGSRHRYRATDGVALPETLNDTTRVDQIGSPGGTHALVRIYIESNVIFFQPLGC